jgi:MFS transporter, ACDE family, multidrug resistance protein
MAIIFVAGLGFGAIQLALPLFLTAIGTAPAAIGLVLSMFGVGMIVFEFGWGWLADRFGVQIPLIVSRFGMAASMVGFALNRSLIGLAIAYLLCAGFMVAGGPLGRAFLGVYLPRQQRGIALGFHGASMTLGGAFGALGAGLLAGRFGLTSIFMIAPVFPVLAGLIGLYVFRGSYSTRLTSLGTEGDRAMMAGAAKFTYVVPVVVISTVVLLMFFGFQGERSFLPILVAVKLNLPAVYSGATLSFLGIATGLLMVPFGRLSDRLGRKPTILVGLAICVVGLIGYGLATTFVFVLAAAAVRAVGTAMMWPAATALLADTTPRSRQGIVMAIYGEFENVGAMVGPILAGYAWGIAGISAAFYSVAFFVALGGIAAAIFIRETRWRAAANVAVAA